MSKRAKDRQQIGLTRQKGTGAVPGLDSRTGLSREKKRPLPACLARKSVDVNQWPGMCAVREWTPSVNKSYKAKKERKGAAGDGLRATVNAKSQLHRMGGSPNSDG